ncbi:major facilitator superfamily domain-containing protein [Talaromyces proteolyticus]|uniref:Major facilitator superfamily domain-containing protein n=1 Tax=Talaromyces proteolyticus TaxID=1131652 RepID=A0AAD4Q2P4_9EURO|nr:major facilitator superfamily domain-containing protein [Talaromyces proteolyticus]KAH8703892.1 major facilitator superfamily domain-containing protein [Talaromyces proteolyticus]
MDSVDKLEEVASKETLQQTRKGLRFWAIMVVLALTSLLTSLEATVTSTVLPVIVADLGGGDNYIWVANAYFLTMAALQPMFGQLANVFGRRWPIILSTVAFVFASGICGGASNMAMMIAGRAIQGVGGSGVGVLCEIIICDLVPLRERGLYMAIVFGMVSLGAALGPLFGGLIVSYSNWRWAFYMALPIGGPALVLLVVFLHVKYDKSMTLATKLSSLDWLGNAVFIGASTSVLIALSWAGGEYPWSSYKVLVPLIIGMVSLVGFVALEATPFTANPMMPLHLFANRITAAVFLLTFLHGLVTMWAFYFLPVYFQGVLNATPYRSGIMLLPTILSLVPGAIIGGVLLTKLGRYKPILFVAFALIVVGFGLFSLLDQNSSTGAWVAFQIIESFGAGLALPVLLPALLAPMTDKDTAVATGTWAFMRSFGVTWGVAIAGTIFSNRAAQLAGSGAIGSNATVTAQFMAGGAYQDATANFLDSLSPQTRAQVVAVQSIALQRSWQVAIAFGGLGVIAAAVVKEVPLRKELDSDFGITEKDNSNDEMAETTEKGAPSGHTVIST